MLGEFIHQASLYHCCTTLLLAALITRLLYNKYGHGINSIPGPTLASFTNLWRFFLVTRRRPELKHIELHQKYGSVIRIGPNVVSVSDPNAVKIIYAINAGFVKVFNDIHNSIVVLVLTSQILIVRLLYCAKANRERRHAP